MIYPCPPAVNYFHAGLSKTQIAALSPQERLALIEDFWDVLESLTLEPAIEAAHREIMQERLANYDPKSETFLTIDEVCRQARAPVKKREVVFRKLAQADLAEANKWYHSIDPALAERLLIEVRKAGERFALHPLAHPTYIGNCRRMLLKVFPYFLYYRLERGS